ncbi:MAG TPA: ROK family protein [bacterium]
MSTQTYVIGIDLGGTKVEACLLDAQRNVLSRCRTPSEPALGLDRVCQNIHKVVLEVAGGKPFSAVGIGTPGTYLPLQDMLFGSPHTPVYETPGFVSRLRREFGVPLAVENDANCLGIAEYFAQCAGTYRFVMAVILGTGLGCGLVLDGKLYRGALGGAGEIGHCTIDYQGRLCECGRRGCAEAYLSGSSLSRRYAELCGQHMEVPQIYQRALAGDRDAANLFEESCYFMGEVFANAVNGFDLEAIILGGGVSNVPCWYGRVPFYLKQSLFGPPRTNIPILKAVLGDSAGVVGAGYLALRELGLLEF